MSLKLRDTALVSCRQGELKCAASRFIRSCPQPSPMRADDGAADREAQPYSAGLGRVKGVEDAFEMYRINSRPRITDRDQNLIRSPSLGADRQLSARAINRAHRFDCVQDQVQDDLLQLHPIPLNEWQAF